MIFTVYSYILLALFNFVYIWHHFCIIAFIPTKRSTSLVKMMVLLLRTKNFMYYYIRCIQVSWLLSLSLFVLFSLPFMLWKKHYFVQFVLFTNPLIGCFIFGGHPNDLFTTIVQFFLKKFVILYLIIRTDSISARKDWKCSQYLSLHI